MRLKPIPVLVLSALVLSATLTNGAYAVSFSNLYVLGDSLSDSGNVHTFTTSVDAANGVDNFPTIPPTPYIDGRFTNGLNFTDVLNQKLFSTPAGLSPSFLGGTNYAIGGATTGAANVIDTLFPGVPPSGMQAQLTRYKNDLGSARADPQALYLVYGGSNDMFAMLNAAADDPLNAFALKDQAIDAAVGNLGDILNQLSDAGAVHFLVPNLPDLGATPRLSGLLSETFARIASEDFNSALADEVSAFATLHAGADVKQLDVFGLLNSALDDPGAFGFTQTSTACYPGDPFAPLPGLPCSDPDHYLFWDDIHPTAATHRILGQAAFLAVSVPEPHTFVLTVIGLGMLGWGAWRRAAHKRPEGLAPLRLTINH